MSLFGKQPAKVKVSPPPDAVKRMPRISASDFKQRLFNFSKKSRLLVLEISEGLLKIAGFSVQSSDRRLLAIASAQTSGTSEIEIGIKIREFLKAHAFKPESVVVLHPSYNLTSRILNLPSTDPREIRDIVDLQAVKQTPYSREEITTGFRILESDPTGYSRVLVAISHRDVSTSYFRAGEMAGFQPNQIHIALEGLCGWFEAFRIKDLDRYDKPVVLLDLDWATTEFLLFFHGRLVFSRNLSLGVKHLTEQGEAAQQDFSREVQRSIEGSQQDLKENMISEIILSGMSAKIKDLLPILSRDLSLPVQDMTSAQPFENRIPKGVRKAMGSAACSFSSLLGFGFDPAPSSINLIPPQLEAKKGLEDRAKDLAILGTMLLALIMLISVISLEKFYKKDRYLRSLKKDYSEVHTSADEVERTLAKMRIASEQIQAGAHFLDVIYDVTEVLPMDVYLTSVQYQTADNALVIRGISEEMSAVFKLITTLEGTAHLEAVKTRNVTKRKVKDKEVVEFEISGSVVRNAPEAPKTEVPQPS